MTSGNNPPLASAWALRLPLASAAALAGLRLTPGIEVAADGRDLWLRGRLADEALLARLRAVPAIERYAWLPEDRLRPVGALLITGNLPALAWLPLAAWLAWSFPRIQLPAAALARAPLILAPSHDAQPANAGLFATGLLLDWMQAAPELRLRPLRFAANREGGSLVLGAPLPSLPGRRFWLEDGVALPAGLALSPPVSARVVRSALAAADGTVVLWDEEGPRLLPEELFVAASRGAARATRAALPPP